MSDVPISRAQLRCLICGRRPFSRTILRRHQLNIHGGETSPAASRTRIEGQPATVPVPAVSSAIVGAPSSVGGASDAADGDAHCGAALHGDGSEIAALLHATAEARPPQPRGHKQPRHPNEHGAEDATTYPSIATRVCAVYETYGDKGRSTRLGRWRARDKAGQFKTRRLRGFQSFVFNTGGCGLSGGDTDRLWDLFY